MVSKPQSKQKIKNSRRKFIKRTSIGVTAALATGLAGCVGGDDEDDADTDNGDDGVPTLTWAYSSGAELATPSGWFFQSDYVVDNVMENLGDSYEIDVLGVQGSPLVISSVGSREADGGVFSYSGAANAIVQETVPSGFSVTSPEVWMGVEDSFSDLFAVLAGSDIQSIEDVEGTNFATNSFGSAIDIAARAGMVQAGLDPEVDLNMREVGFGAMQTQLEEGQIDVGSFVQPIFEGVRDELDILYDMGDPFGSYTPLFQAFRNDFIEENPEAVEGFIEDHWLALQWYNDEENREDVLDSAAEVTELDTDLLDQIVGTDAGYYYGPDGLRIEPEHIQVGIDGMQDVGYLDSDVDISNNLDMSYLPDEADQTPTGV